MKSGFCGLPPAPIAARHNKKTTHWGQTIIDPYAWLRDENWRDVLHDPGSLDPKIRQHLLAENAYCDAAMSDTAALQEALYKDMRARISDETTSVPDGDGAYAYYTRYLGGQEHPLYVRCPHAQGAPMQDEEEILLDGNALAAGQTFFDLGDVIHSPDHARIAYAIDVKGSEYFDIRIRDIKSGHEHPETLHDSNGVIVWTGDSRAFYWVWQDQNGRPREVRRHVIGTDQPDTLIYKEQDPGFFLTLARSSDQRYLFIIAHDHDTSEVHYLDLHTPKPEVRTIAARQNGHEYSVDHAHGLFYIRTNGDKAVDFKIMIVPTHQPERQYWRDFIPAQDGILRLEQRLFAHHHVRLEKENARMRLVVHALTDNAEHIINFEEDAYTLAIEPLFDFETNTMRVRYSSPAQPQQIIDYTMDTRQKHVRKIQKIPCGHNPDDYRVQRIEIKAKDGAMIPVTLLSHRKTPLDGTAPAFLYGYGAYGYDTPAAFSSNRLALVDRGFVFAIAHVRGGDACGYNWYQQGKGEHKTNTFTDFIVVAQSLGDQKMCDPGRIIACGGSAGGLLVGAALNMAPGLFAGAIAIVPFVDVLNTMCDASLPLTPPEWPEWGNPIKDEAAFTRIRAYSPYDNVQKTPYPPLFVRAGLADARVTYWEPAKWVARLRHEAKGGGPFLLTTEMEAGHGGASGRYQALHESALEYAFAIKVAGLK